MADKSTAEQRFERFIDYNGPIPLVRGVIGACWTWTGGSFGKPGQYGDEYGAFRLGNRMIKAHRFAFEKAYGEIPQGLVVDHRCNRRNCVRPSHLQAVTQRLNTLRGMSPNAIVRRTNRCRQGHDLTPETTRTNDAGHRTCLVCERARSRAAYARRRAALTPERTAA